MNRLLRPSAVKPSDNPGAKAAAPAIFQASIQPASTSTYFTKGDGQSRQLYAASRWTKARLLLETAGPVSVGTSDSITPVLSGKGTLLTTNLPFEIDLAPGNKLWIAAESINRVKVTLTPFPWQEQILGGIDRVVGAIMSLVRR